MRPPLPAVGLFLLSPFIGEFVLGNLTLAQLGIGLVLAPMYGGGALLIRELARRTGGGWPMMALLAVAYALIEEGPVDQLLWNDSYAGVDTLHGPTYIPAVGMSVTLTLVVVALHAVWSISVPIAVVEALARERGTVPWLSDRGLRVTAVLYVAGAALVCWGNYEEERFFASPAQNAAVALVIALLIAAAFAVRVRRLPRRAGEAPAPLLVAAAGLAATSAYLGPAVLVGVDWYEWIGDAVWCLVAVAGVVTIFRWSRSSHWGARHRMMLAAGACLTYVWVSFPLEPESGGSTALDLTSNAVFGAVAIGILVWAHVVQRALEPQLETGAATGRD